MSQLRFRKENNFGTFANRSYLHGMHKVGASSALHRYQIYLRFIKNYRSIFLFRVYLIASKFILLYVFGRLLITVLNYLNLFFKLKLIFYYVLWAFSYDYMNFSRNVAYGYRVVQYIRQNWWSSSSSCWKWCSNYFSS